MKNFNILCDEFHKILETNTDQHKQKIDLILRGRNPAHMRQYGLLLDDTGELVVADALSQCVMADDSILDIITRLSLVTLWVRSKQTRKMTLFIQQYTDKVLSIYKDKYTCTKGCSACCHQEINIFPDEGEIIKGRVNLSFYPAFKEQFLWGKSDWEKHKNNACPFLKRNECEIYDFRPVACRNHFSLSLPELCEVDPTNVKNIGDLNIAYLISAFLTVYDLVPMAKHFHNL